MPPRVSATQNLGMTRYFNQEKVRRDLVNEVQFPVIPTRCTPFDWVTGLGGLARGRVTEIYGGESSGKSTVALHLCREDLLAYDDVVVWYLDYERSTAKKYAERMGLLVTGLHERFHLLDLDTLEQADKYAQAMFEQKLFPSIIVCDSVPAMLPADLYGRDMEDTPQIGLQARKMAELLGKWVKFAADYEIAIILINQTRTFIQTDKFGAKKARIPGVLGSEKEDTPGGRAVKFYAAMRLRLEAKQIVVENVQNPMTGDVEKQPVANVVKMVAAKNKCAQPFRAGEFYIRFGYGIDLERTMINLASKHGYITSAGGNFVCSLESGREIKAKGEQTFVAKLREDTEAVAELQKMLKWDKVDELTSQALGVEKVDVASGEIENITPEDALEGVTLSLVEQAPTFVDKALLLGILDKGLQRGALGYTPASGEQVRSRTAGGLWKKLDKPGQEEIKQRVADLIEVIKVAEGKEEIPLEVKEAESAMTEGGYRGEY